MDHAAKICRERRPSGTGARGRRSVAIAVIGLLGTMFAGHVAASDKVTIAVNPATPGGDPIYVGKDKGFFADSGIDLTILKTTTPAAANAAVASGDADVSVFGLSAGFFNAAANSDFTILAAVNYERPGYSGIVFVATKTAFDKGLRSVADLAGKKIGIGGPGGTAQYNLYLVSEKYRFPMNGVTLVILGGDANAFAAARSGAVDATVGASGPATKMEQAGEVKIIGHAGEEHPGGLINVIFTSRKVLNSRRDVLVKFMRGYLRAAAFYAGNVRGNGKGDMANSPQTQEVLEIIARNTDRAAEAVVPGLAYVPPDGDIDVGEVANQLRVAGQLGMLNEKASHAQLVDTSVLQAAKAP